MTKTDIREDETAPSTAQPKGRFSGASERVRGSAQSAKTRASEAYRSARERTSSAYSSARSRASDAGRRTGNAISENPVAAVIGGLAVGAALAALLPKTQREVRALGRAGARLNEQARTAAKSATDASRQKLDELGYAAVKQKIGEFVGGSKREASAS